MARTAATACGLMILGASLAPDLTMACVPPLARSASEQAADDLAEQSLAWLEATTVYVAEIVEFLPARPGQPSAPLLPGAPSHQVVLHPQAVLKGSPVNGNPTIALLIRASCVPSDIERGELGDRFIVYAGPEGPSSRSGILALEAIRHPATLAALEDRLGPTPGRP